MVFRLMVAPFTGAWIEMTNMLNPDYMPNSRSLYGSVD